MKYQKVNMVVRFVVPVGREYYGDRSTETPWKRYAEHDMRQYIKDIEDIQDSYLHTTSYTADSFEWLEEFDNEE